MHVSYLFIKVEKIKHTHKTTDKLSNNFQYPPKIYITGQLYRHQQITFSICWAKSQIQRTDFPYFQCYVIILTSFYRKAKPFCSHSLVPNSFYLPLNGAHHLWQLTDHHLKLLQALDGWYSGWGWGLKTWIQQSSHSLITWTCLTTPVLTPTTIQLPSCLAIQGLSRAGAVFPVPFRAYRILASNPVGTQTRAQSQGRVGNTKLHFLRARHLRASQHTPRPWTHSGLRRPRAAANSPPETQRMLSEGWGVGVCVGGREWYSVSFCAFSFRF